MATSVAYLFPTRAAHSTSAAITRKPSLVSAPGDFFAFDFVSPSLGWALAASTVSVPVANPGQFSVFRTTDGAKHWQKQFTGQSDLSGMKSGSIQMFDKAHGVVVAQGPDTTLLYRTLDGGSHWQPIGLPNVRVQEIAFSDARHGWLLASVAFAAGPPRALYATSDGGDTWQALPSSPVDSIGIAFRGSSEGWLGSQDSAQPHVYATADGGRSWLGHDLPAPPGGIPTGVVSNAFVRLLPGAGVVAYLFLQIGSTFEFTSFDRGDTWTYVPPRPRQALSGWEGFEDASHWWAIDKGILYKSSNAGQTWTPGSDYLVYGNDWQYYPTVIDSRHAWAQMLTGDVTGLALTSDGGRHWTRGTVPQSA
jgi:photosystem II stability/assembly factor-like uncharacterized protein